MSYQRTFRNNKPSLSLHDSCSIQRSSTKSDNWNPNRSENGDGNNGSICDAWPRASSDRCANGIANSDDRRRETLPRRLSDGRSRGQSAT